MVTRPNFYIMGQRWSLVCPEGILLNNDRLQVDNLKVYGMGLSPSRLSLPAKTMTW